MECTLVEHFSHVQPVARWLWNQHHFPALAGIDQLESPHEVFHGKRMGDHRLDFESGLEETCQAIPGFEELAACNTVDANPLKNNFIREIAIDRAGWNAEEAHASAVLHGPEGLMQCRRVPRHFEAGEFRWNGGRGLPEHSFRQVDVFRERSVAIDAQNAVILADMRLSSATLETMTTCDVRLGGDVIAHLDERDVGPDLNHFAAH